MPLWFPEIGPLFSVCFIQYSYKLCRIQSDLMCFNISLSLLCQIQAFILSLTLWFDPTIPNNSDWVTESF